MKRSRRFSAASFAVATSLLLWSTHALAAVRYEVSHVAFSNKSDRGDTASIDMSDGWSLASLTKEDGTPIDFRPLRTNASTVATNNATLFSPDLNIGADGPWVATFNAPAGTVLDHIELPIFLYKGGTNSEYGLPQSLTANAPLGVTVTLINGESESDPLSVSFQARGTNAFSPTPTDNSGNSINNTQYFDFTPQQVTKVKIKIARTEGPDGINAGLTELVFGGYTATPETVTFSNKTSTSIDLSGEWSLSAPIPNFQTNGNVGQTNSLTPNANVGSGTSWNVTFEAPSARTVSSVSFGVVMFDINGKAQSLTVRRSIVFTVDALDKDGNSLGTATSGTLSLRGNDDIAAVKTLTITFENPVEHAKKLKITATRGASETNGCFFGLTQLEVASPLTIATGGAPTENLLGTIWANPTAWPTSALTLGALYLGSEATLPEVAATSDSVTADLIRVLPSTLTVTADEAVTEKPLITATAYRGPAALTVTLAGAGEAVTLRPRETRRYIQLTADTAFSLAIATEYFTTATNQAVLYASGAESSLAWSSEQWWHSAAEGEAAVQGALPEGYEPWIWLENGATIVLDANATALAFVDETQSGILEIPAEVSLAYPNDIAPSLSSPNIPDGITVKLLGSLTMTGTLPALEVSGEAASLGAGEGDLTVTALTGSGTLTVSGGNLSVVTSAAITYALAKGSALSVTTASAAIPAVTVTGSAALTLGSSASATTVTVAKGAILDTDAETIGKISTWSLAGNLSVANATSEMTLILADEAGSLTFDPADLSTRPRGWWGVVANGTLSLGQIAASADSEVSTGEQALFQQILGNESLTIPAGTKAFTYATANTVGTIAGDQAQALAVAELFAIEPSLIGEPDATGCSIATLVYDFGIDGISVQDIGGTRYVTLTVKVQGSGSQAVDFAETTAVAVKALDAQGTVLADCTPEEVKSDFTAFGDAESGSGPVRYFRLPITAMPATGAFFKAAASSQQP